MYGNCIDWTCGVIDCLFEWPRNTNSLILLHECTLSLSAAQGYPEYYGHWNIHALLETNNGDWQCVLKMLQQMAPAVVEKKALVVLEDEPVLEVVSSS